MCTKVTQVSDVAHVPLVCISYRIYEIGDCYISQLHDIGHCYLHFLLWNEHY
jgi:sorbitol-specific phosphotransferase system component IIA